MPKWRAFKGLTVDYFFLSNLFPCVIRPLFCAFLPLNSCLKDGLQNHVTFITRVIPVIFARLTNPYLLGRNTSNGDLFQFAVERIILNQINLYTGIWCFSKEILLANQNPGFQRCDFPQESHRW